MGDLHRLEAEFDAALAKHWPPETGYRQNLLFDRAREVARAAAIFDGEAYQDAEIIVSAWLRKRFRDDDERCVLEPDEIAPIARELASIPAEEVIRWAHKHRRRYTQVAPEILVELFEALVRVVTTASSERLGLVTVWLWDEFREPPKPRELIDDAAWVLPDEAQRNEILDRRAALATRIDEAEARLAAPAATQADARPAPSKQPRAGRGARAHDELPAAAITAGEDELARRFPWLRKLSKGTEIMARFARLIAWSRLNAARDVLPERIAVALPDLLAPDFDDAPLAVERAGRQAVREAIRRPAAGGKGWVMLDMRGGEPDVGVYLGGARLRLRQGRLHIDAFLDNAAEPLRHVQRAYDTAVLAAAKDELDALDEANPWAMGYAVERALDEQIAEDRLADVARVMGWDAGVLTDEAKHDELCARRALQRFVRLCREDWPGYEDQGTALIGLIAPDQAAGLRRAHAAASKLVQAGELLAGLARMHKLWARAEEALDDRHVVRLAGPFHALRLLGVLVERHAGKAPHGVSLPAQAAELARTLDALEAAHRGKKGLVRTIWTEERYWSREVVESAYDELRAWLGRAGERGQGLVWLAHEGDRDPDAARLRMTGYFMVPEAHLGELSGYEAASSAAFHALTRRRRKALDAAEEQAIELRYRVCEAMLAARAAELAAASCVLDFDGLDALQRWLAERYFGGEQRDVLDPDELATMTRRLRRTSAATMLRQGHVSKADAPHVRALFDALVSFVGEARLRPSTGRHGLVLVSPPPMWSWPEPTGA